MNPGDHVFHPALGRGVVSQIIETGIRKGVLVNFGYTKELLRFDELVTDNPTKTEQSQKTSPLPSLPKSNCQQSQMIVIKDVEPTVEGGKVALIPNDPHTEARKGIVALRLGQVLESHIFQLSVGTESLQKDLHTAVARAVQEEKPTFLLIEGSWGGGKTHALTLLQAIARSKGMMTAGAVMDGGAVSLSEPIPLMEEVISSFSFPGEASADGLGCLLRKVVKEGKFPALREKGALEIAQAMEMVPATAFDDPEALHYIEDYFSLSLRASWLKMRLLKLGHFVGPRSMPTMLPSRVADRTNSFAVLLKNWAHFSSVMGGRGLLVVFDELDVEYGSTAYANKPLLTRRQKRRSLLQELMKLKGHKASLLIAFASAPAGIGIDVEHDAVGGIRQTIGSGLIHLMVPRPSEQQLEELLLKIAELYRNAYPTSENKLGADHVQQLFGGLLERYRRQPNYVPRQFVRTALEAFDVLTAGETLHEDVLRMLRAPR